MTSASCVFVICSNYVVPVFIRVLSCCCPSVNDKTTATTNTHWY